MQQVQPELPEFAPARDAIAKLRATTQAAAAAYLCTLTATQFERVAQAASAEVAEDVRGLLLRLAMAENLAEQAVVASPTAAQALAASVSALAGEARETIQELTAETAPVAAAGATDSTTEQDAHAAAAADPPSGAVDPVPIVAEAASDIAPPVPAESPPAK